MVSPDAIDQVYREAAQRHIDFINKKIKDLTEMYNHYFSMGNYPQAAICKARLEGVRSIADSAVKLFETAINDVQYIALSANTISNPNRAKA